ncbi:Dihydropteroate synthase [Heliocybe sulcata]|uniref:Dihydropteroate synthase n=1 Tax=Heliocybe sulcata TaxID=5364 RepID=A0A5C3NAL2_9AGAM|nr:Dihydropteroate synthase [Heliocybe sulcata]
MACSPEPASEWKGTASISRVAAMSSSPSAQADYVRVNDLRFNVKLEDGVRWPTNGSVLSQPVLLTLSLPHDLRRAAQDDDIQKTLDYDALSTRLMSELDSGTSSFPSLEALLDYISDSCFRMHQLEEIHLRGKKIKAVLNAEAVGIERHRTRDGLLVYPDRYFIEGLHCSTIVGINPSEREVKQGVRFHISMYRSRISSVPVDFRQLTQKLTEAVEASSFLTLEALASHVARTVLSACSPTCDRVVIRAAKPNALLHAESSEVEITRTLADYGGSGSSTSRAKHAVEGTTLASGHRPLSQLLRQVSPDLFTKSDGMHTAAIALGSNLGDRFANIELALRLLETPEVLRDEYDLLDDPRISIIDTSFMYETAPMYVTDQPSFINCAALIETDIMPQRLLAVLKKIEKVVGRVPSIRNGPRAVDLDILTFDSEVIDTRAQDARADLSNLEGQLVVPHPRIAERAFVLRPLADMIPNYVLPRSGKSIRQLLADLTASAPKDEPPMYRVIPFPKYPNQVNTDSTPPASGTMTLPTVPPTSKYWRYLSSPGDRSSKSARTKTYIMATLNVTPDSFSDGSQHNGLPAALSYVNSSVEAGMDILDIGGYSTRPGAAYVSPEEESARVVPVITAIRSLNADSPQGPSAETAAHARDALISVDTFRHEVAQAAVLAGANCINDVYAFAGPDYPLTQSSAEHFLKMREIARELAVPVILMHSRGDAGKNKDYSAYSYASDSPVLEGVRVELGERIEAAVKGRGGLRRWLVIVDPGVGFSKTLEGNLDVLRSGAEIVTEKEGNPLAGYPQLIGTSRKSFLGSILEKRDEDGTYEGRKTEPRERGWATAAAVSGAVQQGATAVRVHDVMEMGDVVRVADALWK